MVLRAPMAKLGLSTPSPTAPKDRRPSTCLVRAPCVVEEIFDRNPILSRRGTQRPPPPSTPSRPSPAIIQRFPHPFQTFPVYRSNVTAGPGYPTSYRQPPD